jgi:hypothetical protein
MVRRLCSQDNPCTYAEARTIGMLSVGTAGLAMTFCLILYYGISFQSPFERHRWRHISPSVYQHNHLRTPADVYFGQKALLHKLPLELVYLILEEAQYWPCLSIEKTGRWPLHISLVGGTFLLISHPLFSETLNQSNSTFITKYIRISLRRTGGDTLHSVAFKRTDIALKLGSLRNICCNFVASLSPPFIVQLPTTSSKLRVTAGLWYTTGLFLSFDPLYRTRMEVQSSIIQTLACEIAQSTSKRW